MITTKWPRLLVTGQPVTEEQADEILIRTDSWHMMANDRGWAQQLCEVAAEFGYPPPCGSRASTEENLARWRKWDTWTTNLGVLDLGYLNNDRIISSWIGGPHGWCDWDGTIGCTTYNIGKWPSTDELTKEWQTIAAAFPYLTLTAQVVEDEGEGALAGMWRILDGTVTYRPNPTSRIADPADPQFVPAEWATQERGCSIDRFRQALTRVANQTSKEE